MLISNDEIPAFLGHVERVQMGLAGVAAFAAALIFGLGPATWGVVTGGVVGTLNFAALKWLGSKFLDAPGKSRTFYASLFMGKLTALFGVIALCLVLLPIEPLGFLVGVSVLMPAIAITYFWRVLIPTDPTKVGPLTETKG
jgi:hypothetical protein